MILFQAADLTFAIRCSNITAIMFEGILEAFHSDEPPCYFLDVKLRNPRDRLPVDTDRRYTIDECEHFVAIQRVDANHLQATIEVEHRDIASATIGYLLALALSENQGMIVHASAIVKDERSFVFIGPSGAGKTTVVRNSTGNEYIHDDRVAIRRISGRWRVFGIPMCDNDKQPGKNISALLDELFFLRKSNRLKITKLAGQATALQLSAQTLVPFDSLDVRRNIYSILLEAVSQLDCYQLQFTKDCDVVLFLSAVT